MCEHKANIKFVVCSYHACFTDWTDISECKQYSHSEWGQFQDWKENMLIVLGYMDLDLALRTEQPSSLTAASTPDQRKDFEKWERSNRLSLMIIKRGIPEAFRGQYPKG